RVRAVDRGAAAQVAERERVPRVALLRGRVGGGDQPGVGGDPGVDADRGGIRAGEEVLRRGRGAVQVEAGMVLRVDAGDQRSRDRVERRAVGERLRVEGNEARELARIQVRQAGDRVVAERGDGGGGGRHAGGEQ